MDVFHPHVCIDVLHLCNSDYWEKKPLLIRRKKDDYYQDLFSSQQLDDIIRQVHLEAEGCLCDNLIAQWCRTTSNTPSTLTWHGEFLPSRFRYYFNPAFTR
jgi:hypothetical protein